MASRCTSTIARAFDDHDRRARYPSPFTGFGVLPGIVGVEFNPPVLPELTAHIVLLVAERSVAEAEAV